MIPLSASVFSIRFTVMCGIPVPADICRREGDRFRPAHRGCSKSLRALFGEAGLTRRERAVVPVLRDEAGILAVLGFGQDARCTAACGDPVIRITWTEDAE